MKSLLLSSLLLLSAPAIALGAPSTERLIRQAHVARGPEFLNLAEQLRAAGPEATEAIHRRAQGLRFADAWRRDLDVLMLDAVLQDPEIARATANLRGLDPTVYLATRRPSPSVGHELEERELAPAALFLAYYHLSGGYTFAPRADYPAAITDTAFGELRRNEQAALRHGLLVAIAASGHPAAPRLLAEVAQDPQVDDVTRGVAAAQLGETQQASVAVPVLARLVEAKESTTRVRTSALAGLGHLRSAAAAAPLLATARTGRSPELRRSAITALGNLGSAWVASTDTSPLPSELRGQIAQALVEVLTGPEGAEVEVHALEALGRVAWAPSLEALRRLAQEGNDPGVRDRAERGAGRVELALRRLR